MNITRLICKYIKDGKTYYLWNIGSYYYELTTFKDINVATFNNMGLDEVQAELTKHNYIKCETE